MATTEEYKNGGSASYSFSIEYIKAEDIKVSVDGTALTYTATNPPAQTTEYTVNGSNVIFKQASVSGSTNGGVRIYRETELENSDSVTFHAGSSIRAADLNANHKLVRFSAQEKNQEIVTADIRNDAITNAKIADNQIDSEHYVDGSIDRVHLAADIVDGTKIADDSINSEHYVDGSIDEQHLSNSAISSTKIADNAVTTTEILNGAVTRAKLEADIIDGTKLADNAVDSEHYTDGSIDRVHLEADIIDSTKLADNAVNSEHYVDGSIDRVHLEADIIDSTKLADDAVGAEHIQANAVTDSEIATGTLDNRYFTETELTNGALDGRYFTETESDARYFNVSTGDTIKDGDTFPDNDTTIATTAAINDRIIDLVDDVGGFVPIANELSFPNANPDVNNGTGTLISIKALSQNLTSNGSGQISISNGTVGNSTVTITGAANSTTYAATFGMIVETTTTLNTYTFHRLVPKATEVTTVAGNVGSVNTVAGAISNVNAVAGNASNINTVAGINANVTTVAGISSNVTSVANNESNINAVQGNATNINAVAGNNSNITAVAGNASNINSAVSNASNINSAVSNASNITTVAGSISNVNTTAGSISNVNSVASNMANVNNFNDKYQIAANNPSTDGGGNALAAGDLYFNTSANELKVYNGSSWQGGVTASGSFASTTGNTFTGDNRYNDGVKALFGTGSDLQIYHSGTGSYIDHVGSSNGHLFIRGNGTDAIILRAKTGENSIACHSDGDVSLYYDGVEKLETVSHGFRAVNTGADAMIRALGPSGYNGSLILTADAGASNEDNYKLEANTDQVFRIYGRPSGTYTSYLEIHSDGKVRLPRDNQKLQIGASQDLEIYHSGTHSFIDHTNGVGHLVIGSSATNNVDIMKAGFSEYIARFRPDSSVELYFDNSKKFETTSAGVKVSSGHLKLNDNSHLQLGDATNGDAVLLHNGTDTILDNQTGNLFFRSGSTHLQSLTGEDKIVAEADGAVELYHNNNKKFETYANGAKIIDGDTDVHLQLASSSGTNGSIYGIDGTKLVLLTSSNEYAVECIANGAVNLYHNNVKVCETDPNGLKILGPEGGAAEINLFADEGDDNIDKYRIQVPASNGMLIQNFIDGAWETNIKLTESTGAVELYYNNSKRLETLSNGVYVTGNLEASGNIRGNDNTRVQLGTANDLEIYHNGTDSIIENSTNAFFIKSQASARTLTNAFIVNNFADNESIIDARADAAVSLFYDGTKKFETTSTGAAITGQLDHYGGSYDNASGGYIRARNNSARFTCGGGNNCHWYHDGSNGYIENRTGNFYIKANVSETGIAVNNNGAVELYYDNSKQVETVSTGIKLNDSKRVHFGSDNDAYITHDNQHLYIQNYKNNTYIQAPNMVALSSTTTAGSSQEHGVKYVRNGAVELYYDNSMKITTTNSGARVNGNLVINDGSQLQLQNSNANRSSEIVNGAGSGQSDLQFKTNGTHRATLNYSGHFEPAANNTYDLGTSSYRWANVYTNDLNLSNEGSSNDVDGSWGDWTIQEGESDLFLKNNRSGKKYKFNLTEVS